MTPVAHNHGGHEPVAGPSGAGTVVLDVGDDRGALIVWAPPALAGAELEVRRQGTPWRGQHTAVRPRRLRAGTRFAALFDGLGVGRYEMRVRGTGALPVIDAVVAAGTVGETVWPGGSDRVRP